jgi:hypothetical protein
MWRGRPPGEKRRAHGGEDRLREVLELHLGDRRVLHVAEGDHWNETSMPGLRSDDVGVVVDRAAVQRVNLGSSARGGDRPDDGLRRCTRTAPRGGPSLLARECTRDGAADRAAAAVDHGALVLEQPRARPSCLRACVLL